MKIWKENIAFQCDDYTLRGVLHLPGNTASSPGPTSPCGQLPPLMVGSHGLEGTMNSAKQLLFAKLLPENGIAFFRFNHRGCGSSDGDFIKDTSLRKRVRDMVCAVEHVMSLNLTNNRIMLFGSSLGGATCISTWHRLMEKGITPLGAVICAAPVNSITIENIPTKANENRPELPFTFFEDNLLFDLSDKLSAIKNVLIVHGDKDRVVPVENAYNLYGSAGDPKKMIILKDGDHQMSDKTDRKRFEAEALLWIKTAFCLI